MHEGEAVMKWHKVVYATLAGAVLLGSAMVLPAIAQTPVNPPQDNIPGSFLVFPLFDISSGHNTTIRITDVSGGNLSGPGENGPFSVRVHIDVICKKARGSSDKSCDQNNNDTVLTFHETVEFEVRDLVRDPSPTGACAFGGYIIAFAEDPLSSNPQAIAYNNLIGSYHVANSSDLDSDNASYGGNAIAFQANAPSMPGSPPTPIGTTVGVNGDFIQLSFGLATSNDYVAFPRYLVSTFQATSSDAKTEIVLLTFPDGVPNADAKETDVSIQYWNENEHNFSASDKLWCWDRVELQKLDQHFNEGTNINSTLGSDVGSLKVIHSGQPVLGVIIEEGSDGGIVARNMQHFGVNGGPATITTFQPE